MNNQTSARGVLLFVIWGLLAAQAAAEELAVTDKDNGRAFTVKVGGKILVNLRHPGNGGYNFLVPEFDKNILKMVGERPLPPAEPRRLGDFGRKVYEFEAVKPGRTPLVFPIKRVWEKEAKTYLRVTVTVQP